MSITQTLPHFARIFSPENEDGFSFLMEIYYSDPIKTKQGDKVNAQYVKSGKSFQFNSNKLRLAQAYATSQGVDQSEIEGYVDVPATTESELPA